MANSHSRQCNPLPADQHDCEGMAGHNPRGTTCHQKLLVLQRQIIHWRWTHLEREKGGDTRVTAQGHPWRPTICSPRDWKNQAESLRLGLLEPHQPRHQKTDQKLSHLPGAPAIPAKGNPETTWNPTTSVGSHWHRSVPLPRRRVHAGSRLLRQVFRCPQTWTEHQQQHGDPSLEADTRWAWDSPEDHQR